MPKPYFGEGTGKPVWGDNIHCNGTEHDLNSCQFEGWGVNTTCSHDKDVTVACLPEISTGSEGRYSIGIKIIYLLEIKGTEDLTDVPPNL